MASVFSRDFAEVSTRRLDKGFSAAATYLDAFIQLKIMVIPHLCVQVYLINSLKYLLDTYYVVGTVLGAGDTAENNRGTSLIELTF